MFLGADRHVQEALSGRNRADKPYWVILNGTCRKRIGVRGEEHHQTNEEWLASVKMRNEPLAGSPGAL